MPGTRMIRIVRNQIETPATLLDVLGTMFPDSSRTTLRQMLQHGRIRVNSEIEKDGKRMLRKGEVVEIGQKIVAPNLPPEVFIEYEDDDVIVIVKANGLLTVPTERERETTAQAFLNAYMKEKGKGRIHVVHRLDRETSGVLVFAKNFDAREALKAQFAAHSADRMYVAVVEGQIEPPDGTFRSNLLEMRDLRMVSVTSHPDAKSAVTHYHRIRTNGRYSLLEVTLETGRKNQIRAHLSEANHPVVGDRLYGATTNPLERLGLHAKLLGFTHPTTGKRLTFTASVPRSFLEIVS